MTFLCPSPTLVAHSGTHTDLKHAKRHVVAHTHMHILRPLTHTHLEHAMHHVVTHTRMHILRPLTHTHLEHAMHHVVTCAHIHSLCSSLRLAHHQDVVVLRKLCLSHLCTYTYVKRI